MKTQTLTALRNMYYDGDRKTGEEFEVREEHVQPLIITGAAKLSDEADKAKRYQRRDLRAES